MVGITCHVELRRRNGQTVRTEIGRDTMPNIDDRVPAPVGSDWVNALVRQIPRMRSANEIEEPISQGSGAFADPRSVWLELTLAGHEIDAALLSLRRLLP
jgi:hypothetical protein